MTSPAVVRAILAKAPAEWERVWDCYDDVAEAIALADDFETVSDAGLIELDWRRDEGKFGGWRQGFYEKWWWRITDKGRAELADKGGVDG